MADGPYPAFRRSQGLDAFSTFLANLCDNDMAQEFIMPACPDGLMVTRLVF